MSKDELKFSVWTKSERKGKNRVHYFLAAVVIVDKHTMLLLVLFPLLDIQRGSINQKQLTHFNCDDNQRRQQQEKIETTLRSSSDFASMGLSSNTTLNRSKQFLLV